MGYVETQKAKQLVGWQILDSIAARFDLGMTEVEAFKVAEEQLKKFGVAQVWHPTVVKFEEATVLPGVRHKPSNLRKLESIAYIDLGVVIGGVEVDCGKSFGFTDQARRLASDAEKICHAMITRILQDSSISPSKSYSQYLELAESAGYRAVGKTAGHRLGPYPTKKKETKISASDASSSFESGAWMFEVHLSSRAIGAFHEELFFAT